MLIFVKKQRKLFGPVKDADFVIEQINFLTNES